RALLSTPPAVAGCRHERHERAVGDAQAFLHSGFFLARSRREVLLGTRRNRHPQISSAISTTRRSFAHCSSSERTLPSSVEAKPHCGDRQSCSRSTYLVASSMGRLMSSFFSSAPL